MAECIVVPVAMLVLCKSGVISSVVRSAAGKTMAKTIKMRTKCVVVLTPI